MAVAGALRTTCLLTCTSGRHVDDQIAHDLGLAGEPAAGPSERSLS
jgi:hypothetical protein